jgi:hypothetical protein
MPFPEAWSESLRDKRNSKLYLLGAAAFDEALNGVI